MEDCVFCKIVRREISSLLLYEDEHVIAIKDIHPQAPVHLLIIPKKHIEEFYKLTNDTVLVAMKKTIQKLIEENDLVTRGYRVEANGGGAQLVNHLHVHLMGPIEKPQ